METIDGPRAVRGTGEGGGARTLSIGISTALGLASGIFAFAAGIGATGSPLVAAVLASATAVIVALAHRKHPIVTIEAGAASRGLRVLSALATVAALAVLGRLTVFMVDASRAGYSLAPSSRWELQHSCVSAYFVAAREAGRVPNVYADSLYSAADDDPRAVRRAKMIGPFNVDVYEYPPPFLLVPRALRLVVPDFLRFRALWFGLNGAALLFAMLLVARAMGRAAGTRALLLSPLVWIAIPTLSTLQKGNIQVTIVALAMLAMVCFERRRHVAGGALLAYATASKLYPGVLLVYLLVRRQWRSAAWTAAWGAVLAGATVLDTGWRSYGAFLTQFPRLLSGEAFPAFRNPRAMAINFSVPGLVFKLKLFGVAGMSFDTAKLVGTLYTLFVVAAIALVARRTLRAGHAPLVWLAILVLATLRSPFLPQAYAAVPPLMLLVLVGATFAPTRATLAAIGGGWLVLNVFWPMDWPMDARALAVLSGVPQLATMVVAGLALAWSTRAAEVPEAGLPAIAPGGSPAILEPYSAG